MILIIVNTYQYFILICVLFSCNKYLHMNGLFKGNYIINAPLWVKKYKYSYTIFVIDYCLQYNC